MKKDLGEISRLFSVFSVSKNFAQLDDIAKYGVSKLFAEVAFGICIGQQFTDLMVHYLGRNMKITTSNRSQQSGEKS